MNHKSVRAANCDVYSPEDGSHVKKMTPMDIKQKQMLTATEIGIDAKREKSTSRLRKDLQIDRI